MKKILAVTVCCTLIAITGCSQGLAEALFAVWLYGSMAGLIIMAVFLWSGYIHFRERRYEEGKEWEREQQEEKVTEYDY